MHVIARPSGDPDDYAYQRGFNGDPVHWEAQGNGLDYTGGTPATVDSLVGYAAGRARPALPVR
jgi:hypothetical protein